jgi:hypothetical protein
LQQRVEVLNTADELSAAIKDIWENLSVNYIQGLYHSIPKRLRKVLKVKGRNDKVLSKGKHLFHKFIGFLLMQNLMLKCRHLGFCR